MPIETEDKNNVHEEEINVDTEKDKKKQHSTTRINILNDNEDFNIFKGRKEKQAEENQQKTKEELDEEELNREEEEEEEEEDDDEKENSKDDDLKPEDFDDISSFVIELFDMGVSKLSCAIAKEHDSSQFEIKLERRDKLKKQFSRILAKHNFKVTIEWLFVISLGISIKQPIMLAMEIRNKKKKGKFNKEQFTQEQKNKEESKKNNEESIVYLNDDLQPKVRKNENNEEEKKEGYRQGSRGPKRQSVIDKEEGNE